MGTSGVKWVVDKVTLITSLKARKGKLIYVAKDFNVDRHTVLKAIREDEELEQLLAELRGDYDEDVVDMAEDTLLYALSVRGKDLSSALRAAFYILNTKGRSRGYTHPKSKEYRDETSDWDELRKAIQEMEKANRLEVEERSSGDRHGITLETNPLPLKVHWSGSLDRGIIATPLQDTYPPNDATRTEFESIDD